MKLIRTEDAVGSVLCQDMTQIIPGKFKGARFKKGHIVTAEDIPVLLSMGKENLYVFELKEGWLHENDAAARLARIAGSVNMTASDVSEGKIELRAAIDGCFLVDTEKLNAVNSIDQLMMATRKGGTAVKKGDKLCGTRIIPLVIEEEKIRQAEQIVGEQPVLSLLPYTVKTAAIITTGSEVAKGLIKDSFTPIVERKLADYGISVIFHETPGDGVSNVAASIARARTAAPDLILCTGGMSVDPDDSTPGAIAKSGAQIVSYGAPVLPGAMLLVGYYADGTPVLGLPGCVMFAKATVFDLILPRVAAGVRLAKKDIVAYGEGGLCLGCPECTYPQCAFGK